MQAGERRSPLQARLYEFVKVPPRSHYESLRSIEGGNCGGDAVPHASSEIFIPAAQRGSKQKCVFDPGLGGPREEHENRWLHLLRARNNKPGQELKRTTMK